jgi:hypothetical protein
MRRYLGIPVGALALCLGLAQLIQPRVENLPVDPARSLWNDRRVDPRVTNILGRACADCHSQATRWPWYAKISPFSWYIARHVTKGRAKLNFSDWSGASPNQVEEIYESIEKRKMPPANYKLMHPEARLSTSDLEILQTWVDGKLEIQP